ncbi:MAG: glucose-1-phosphate thymidylyltransferase RfbA [Acidimicrobiia bacterium]
MKGIVLAGGSGTRLDPMTRVSSKQLQPVYDKPMIYYPLSTLMESGIREILIVSTPHDIVRFEDLLGDGANLGLDLRYAIQTEPRGIADAFLVARDFLDGTSVALILGDNLFYGFNFRDHVEGFGSGALIFGYPVTDPRRYGVAEVDAQGVVLSIEEKPSAPRSNLAVPGFYLFDGSVLDRVSRQTPSERGELEITDLNLDYLSEGLLRCVEMGRGSAWLDSGTHDSLLDSANFIATLEHRQGLKIACLEETAFRAGFIDQAGLVALIEDMPQSAYRQYVQKVLDEALAS